MVTLGHPPSSWFFAGRMHAYAIAQAAVARHSPDGAAVFPTEDGLFVAVADGVSGGPGGREAAALVNAMVRAFSEHGAHDEGDGRLVSADTLVALMADIDRAVDGGGEPVGRFSTDQGARR